MGTGRTRPAAGEGRRGVWRCAALSMAALSMAALTLLGVGCEQTILTALDLGEVAVVTGDFDTVEQILAELEVDFTLFDGFINGPAFASALPYDPTILVNQVEGLLIENPNALFDYDVLFLTSGMRGAGDQVYNRPNPDSQLVADPAVAATLRAYVEDGGFIYAADWSYDLIEAAFPDQIDFLGDDTAYDAAQRGRNQQITAEVVDPDLAEFLALPADAREVAVVFDFDRWAVAESTIGEVLIQGDVAIVDPETGVEEVREDLPLLITFDVGDGKVIFTSFHVDPQVSDDVRRIVEYLVFLFNRDDGPPPGSVRG